MVGSDRVSVQGAGASAEVKQVASHGRLYLDSLTEEPSPGRLGGAPHASHAQAKIPASAREVKICHGKEMLTNSHLSEGRFRTYRIDSVKASAYDQYISCTLYSS